VAQQERAFAIEGPKMIQSFRWQSLVGAGGIPIVGPSTDLTWRAPPGLLVVCDQIVFTAVVSIDPGVGFWRLYFRPVSIDETDWANRRKQVGL